MNKQSMLDEIAREIERCRKCKIGKSGVAVAGEGNPDADIVFIGEAPGKEESRAGRPFVGRSGRLLRSTIRDIGLKEEDVFITSPVKYLPERGTPDNDDISHGRTHLFKQLDIIAPKIIILMGNTACLAVLEEKVQVSGRHGNIVEKNGRKCLITFHPAAAMRFPKVREGFVKDFAILKNMIADLGTK